MTIGAVCSLAYDELPGLKILAHEMAAAAFTFFKLAGDQGAGKMRIQQLSCLGSHVASQAGAALGPLFGAGGEAGGPAPGVNGNMAQG